MIGQTIREKHDDADYVIMLIDGENYLSIKEGDYRRPWRYGIPENAKGLKYLERAEEGNLVLGYKTIKYRKYEEDVEWKNRKRLPCKNNGIFAVFEVETGFKRYHAKDWNSDYPNTIVLRPLFFLNKPITFQNLKDFVPKSEYVENCRRSVTRFSKIEAKKIFDMMRKNNLPEITEKINKIF